MYREQAGKWFISLLICLLSLSCSHGNGPTDKNPADIYPLPPGMGAFTLRLADSAGRTIMPDSLVLSDFAVFNLRFERTNAAPVAVVIDEDRSYTGAELDPFILAVGTYKLTVSAYNTKPKADANLAAREETSITINPGSDNAGTVELKPLLSGNGHNNGTFNWNITINAGGTAVNSATMTIKNSSGAQQGAAVNLLSASTGTRGLAPGIYTVVFNLAGKEGTDKEKAAEWNELLYVYATLTSSFIYNFNEDYFSKTHWNVTFDYDTNANANDTYHDTIAIGTQSVLHGVSLNSLSPAPLLVPAKRGYRFDGWFTDKACTETKKWDLNNPIHHDMDLWAGWTPNKYTLTLSFDAITDPMAGKSFPEITVSRTGSNGYPVTAEVSIDAGLYDPGSIKWEIAGVGVYAGQKITGTGAAFTIDAAKKEYNSLGGHVLKLEVEKNGKTYRVNINFNIVD